MRADFIRIVVQLLSRVWLFVTPWTAAHQASLSSPYPGICSNACPLNRWCHLTISSSVTLFSTCLRSFPASGSFPMSWLFASGKSFGASPSASVLPMNIQGLFPLRLIGLNPCCPRDSPESSPATQFKSINSSVLSFFYDPTLISLHGYWKNHSFGYKTFIGKVMALLFNTLSRFVIAFLPKSTWGISIPLFSNYE